MQEEEENLLQEFSLAPGLHKVISVCIFNCDFRYRIGKKEGKKLGHTDNTTCKQNMRY